VQPPQLPSNAWKQVGNRAADATLAAVAHAAIVFGFFGVGFVLSVAINVVLWLYSRRSPYVAYHAEQAGCYQCFVLVFNILYIFVFFLFLGFSGFYPQWTWVGKIADVMVILGVFWFVFSIVYGLWAAVRVLAGKPFAYPVFGKLAARHRK
jgi:hypothetical protein